MTNNQGRMDESILVCVYYGPNGERLITRGGKLAKMLGCDLHILTIDQHPFDEFDAEKSDYITYWQQLSKDLNATSFTLKDNEKRPVSKVIADFARDNSITQIILGQTAQSRWEQLTKGSIINSLLREIPFVDLHIISVSRSLRDDEGIYEKGIRAYLIPNENQYKLTFNHSKDTIYEGIFFKEHGTDFNNGVFKFMKDSQIYQVNVIEDVITELKNVRMNDIEDNED